MYAPPKTVKRNRSRRDEYGKNVCLSVPYHKLNWIERMDQLVAQEGWESRSQMLLALFDKRYRAVFYGNGDD